MKARKLVRKTSSGCEGCRNADAAKMGGRYSSRKSRMRKEVDGEDSRVPEPIGRGQKPGTALYIASREVCSPAMAQSVPHPSSRH